MNHDSSKIHFDNGLLKSPQKIKEESEEEEEEVSEHSLVNESNSIPVENNEEVVEKTPDKKEVVTPVKPNQKDDLKIKKATSHEQWEMTNQNAQRTIVKIYDDELYEDKDQTKRKKLSFLIEEEEEEEKKRYSAFITKEEKANWVGVDYEAHAPIVEKLHYLEKSIDEEDEYLNYFQNGSSNLLGKER